MTRRGVAKLTSLAYSFSRMIFFRAWLRDLGITLVVVAILLVLAVIALVWLSNVLDSVS